MSVKKILVLSAASLAVVCATAVMAGGPDHMAMPVKPVSNKSIYLEGGFGYDQTDWANNNTNALLGVSNASLYNPNSHGLGYLTATMDLGYNFTKNIALEGGYTYLPSVSGGSTGTTIGGITASGGVAIRSWVAYLAAKLSVPVMEHLNLFGKVGAAYRRLNYAVSGTASGTTSLNPYRNNGHYWMPLFATGIQYDWHKWLLGAQYAYIPANNQVNTTNVAFGAPNSAPDAHLYTGTLGYRFDV